MKKTGRPSRSNLPRFVIEKKLASGIGYYWNPPICYRRDAGFPIGRPLGSDLNKALAKAEKLNARFEAWRNAHVRVPISRARRTHRRRGFVYFVAQGAFVKIGFAKNVDQRLLDLSVGSPVPLRILHTEEGFDTLERRYHLRFKQSRVQGEWFRLDESLRKFIDEKTKQVPFLNGANAICQNGDAL